ncbi:acyl-CoA thioesterase [Syntrophorhabdus aromaticivorans]|uniref:acyl-CoA thioesterase n=1 Tax=Syntrophorhabdus aromaticivorans TaxID=328301 RepID=UPI0004227035|nr:thioesterase family protein [Syntrophorhabdus aromaticivorans]HBA53392.1 esterase [Syntrophorhabdus aromaticivorans]
MSRIRLSEQSQYEFHYTITLQPRDINYGGHLGNDALVSLLGAARANTLRSMDLSEADLGDGRTGIIMSDLAVNFRAEGFMFDELLIDTHIGEFSRTGFRIFHRATKGETLVALAETGITAFDYVSRRIAPVPGTFLRILAESTASGSD